MKHDTSFMVDQSLSGLCKWLRLLGFDTVIHMAPADAFMVRVASSEGRIQITRNREFHSLSSTGENFLVTELTVARQLKSVLSRYDLKPRVEKMHTLCLVCNRPMETMSRHEAFGRVPQYIFERTEQFTFCPGCDRVYWPGTHLRNALIFLKDNHIDILE